MKLSTVRKYFLISSANFQKLWAKHILRSIFAYNYFKDFAALAAFEVASITNRGVFSRFIL